MARGKKHSPEQIVSLLRQIEVAIANGKTTPQVCKDAGTDLLPLAEELSYRTRVGDFDWENPNVKLATASMDLLRESV
jgi:hypothetical protein